ncbi:MAG: protein translocase subunit SecF [Leptolyngbya sp. SIO4C1]|nr:protein translocase subunit SecF [Leptolyngbya sp. SIO4C1]
MKLNVIKQRGLWWTLSSIVILAGIAAMAVSWTQFNAPIRPSLDFVGGTRLQLERDCAAAGVCDGPIDLGTVRQVLAEQGLENSSVQLLGEDRQALSVRTRDLDVDQRTQLQQALAGAVGDFDPATAQIDTVGPTIGQQLLTAGLLALLVAFAGITIYLSLRFQFDYAVLALVALLHDVLVTLGIFSILGLTLGYEADSLFIVALLTIVGFSVNDTVVIYDRIRENLKLRSHKPINDVVDSSVNQTLARSINTTFTTVLSLVAIVLFGGETLKFFALALIIGFIAGAYSSIFIASTLLAWWRSRGPQPTDRLPDELPADDTELQTD